MKKSKKSPESNKEDNFYKTVLKRSKTAWQEYKNGNTLSFDQIKKEFIIHNL